MKTGLRRTVPVLALSLVLGATLAACGTASEDVEPTVTRIDVPGAPPTRTATLAEDEEPAATESSGSPVPSEANASPSPVEPDASPSPVENVATPEEAASPTSDGAAMVIEVAMVDLAFEPKELTIPANTDVTIIAINNGVLEHNFSVKDHAISTGAVAAGTQGSVVINLPAGEYEYDCNIPGHTEAGMTGKLIVE